MRPRSATPRWNPTELTDTDLVARIGSDDRCFRELIVRHEQSLRRLAWSLLRNRHDAEEAVQDAFVAAHRAASGFRNESSVRTWLHSICYRQCLGRLRRKRLDLVVIAEHDSPAAPADMAMRIALELAVDALPEANRVAFVLVDVLGFSREDAAAMVEVPGNTMRARVARARMLLADALTDTGEADR
jgi:RNA polymerase sigma-70 factor (ECF subfamily)